MSTNAHRWRGPPGPGDSSVIPTFRHSQLPSFPPSVIPAFRRSRLTRHSCLPSFPPSVIPARLPSFLPSVVPRSRHSRLPSFSPPVIPAFRHSPYSFPPTVIPTYRFPPTVIPTYRHSHLLPSFPSIPPSRRSHLPSFPRKRESKVVRPMPAFLSQRSLDSRFRGNDGRRWNDGCRGNDGRGELCEPTQRTKRPRGARRRALTTHPNAI